MKFLLLQSRDEDDPMGAHERACIARRLEGTGVALTARNALLETAHPRWLTGVDALLIGGSGDYSVHHPESEVWVSPMREVLDEALRQSIPGFGLCFGHQLLGMHLGASVQTEPACEEVGTVEVQLTEAGRADPLLKGFAQVFSVHTGHTDCVMELPQGVELLVTGSPTATQAFVVAGSSFYSTQFHPDLTGAEARARYLSNKQGPGIEAARKKAEAYRIDRDESTALLKRFVALVRERS